MWRKIARKGERQIEDEEEVKRRRSESAAIGDEAKSTTEGGYAQVGGSSSSSGGDQAASEQSRQRQDLADTVDDNGQVAKRGKDHSEEDVRSQEKRMRREDASRQEADAVADRIVLEYGISELRSQSVECEASRALAAIEVWVQEIA